jgi:hypothetical protein
MVPLGSIRSHPVFLASLAIIAFFSTAIVLVLRDRKPKTS